MVAHYVIISGHVFIIVISVKNCDSDRFPVLTKLLTNHETKKIHFTGKFVGAFSFRKIAS